MGEYADWSIQGFMSGRRGMPMPKQREYPKVARADIAHKRFKLVTVVGGRTNRTPGMKLIVTEQDETTYHVWASKGVTGIAQAVCKTLHEDLSLSDALRMLGRKPYYGDEAEI
ncbi:hypothetical protein ACOTHJ_12890 [Achromobacter xylosoxidans]|uniref:hypothetical protein n=1 Tax=Achromobacter anxifer TaxID=1287737 RepID=UPI00155C1A61|nr:hypothetical protein [Achromobacter anxifer]CAB5514592.1 hypothetical protein LMG26857_03651 [Achromobacter anxifer]